MRSKKVVKEESFLDKHWLVSLLGALGLWVLSKVLRVQLLDPCK